MLHVGHRAVEVSPNKVETATCGDALSDFPSAVLQLPLDGVMLCQDCQRGPRGSRRARTISGLAPTHLPWPVIHFSRPWHRRTLARSSARDQTPARRMTREGEPV